MYIQLSDSYYFKLVSLMFTSIGLCYILGITVNFWISLIIYVCGIEKMRGLSAEMHNNDILFISISLSL